MTETHTVQLQPHCSLYSFARRLDLDLTKCGDEKYLEAYLDPFNIEVRDG